MNDFLPNPKNQFEWKAQPEFLVIDATQIAHTANFEPISVDDKPDKIAKILF